MTVCPHRAFPIVSNGACQDKPQMKMVVKFHLDGFSFDRKEVFILLLRHLSYAGVGTDLKATCQKAAVLTAWSAITIGINDHLCSFPSVEVLEKF